MKRILPYIVLLLAAVLHTACSDYDDRSQSDISGPAGKANFCVKLPEGNTVNVTVSRSINEEAIQSIDLFFFEKKEIDGKKEWVYHSHSKAEINQRTTVSGLCEFKADVPKNIPVVTHLIANFDFSTLRPDGQDFFTWISGKTVNEFAAMLLDTRHIQPFNDSNSVGTSLITMWGYQGETTFKTNNQGVVTNNIDNIDMRRDVAKITVKLSDEEIAKDRFHLTQVMIYNPMDKAYIIPVANGTTTDYPENYPRSETEFHNMEDPIIPDDAVHLDNKWYVSDDHTPQSNNTDFTGVPNSYDMYVFPCWNTKDKTNGEKAVKMQRDKRLFLILKGFFKYQGRWIEGYYRVDIATLTYADGSSYIKDFKLWDLTRKDNYIVTLKEVSGPGYNTPEDAKEAPMSNLIIMDMSTVPTGQVLSAISNGQYRMAVSNPDTYFFQNATSNDVNADGWREGEIHLADLYLHSLLTEENLNKGSVGGQQTNQDVLNEAAANQPTLSEPFNESHTVKSIQAKILGEEYGDDYYQGTDLINTTYNKVSEIYKTSQYAKGLMFKYIDKDTKGNELPTNDKHVEIWIYRKAFDEKEEQNRLRTIRITAGNLIRDLRIYQGRKGTFTFEDAMTGLDTQQYPTYYIGWEAKTKLEIPIKVSDGAIIPASGLKCRVNLNYGGLGFMSLQDESASGLITIDKTTKKATLKLTTSAAYYSTQKDIYRTNQIAITAKGMEDGVFAVKQSKYLDGVGGFGIAGSILNDNDTKAYELDFGYVEQDWQATVENGTEKVTWLKLEKADNDADATVSDENRKITGKRQMKFKFQMTANDTGNNRYCKVVLKFGNLSSNKLAATHIVYFQQGLNDIEVNGVTNHGSGLGVSGGWIENFGTRHWMCYNVNPATFRKGYEDQHKSISDYPCSPEDPGIMFQFENITNLYYGSGAWGKDYATAYAQLSNNENIKSHYGDAMITKMKAFYSSTWNANGGHRTVYNSEWTNWGYSKDYNNVNPCPKGYRLPYFHEWQGIGFEINGYSIGSKIENKKQASGKLLIAKNGGFDYAYWGRITFGNSDIFRAGVLLVGENSNGQITKMLFLPAAGTLSQTLSSKHPNGALVSTHYKYIENSPEYNFGNQGGTYWAINPKLFWNNGSQSGISSVEIYHDPSHNIGLLPNQNYNFYNVHNDNGYMSIHDAMPVRCVRDENTGL